VQISAAIKKNQPPTQLIILSQISAPAATGSSTVFSCRQRSKRKIVLASGSSLGIVVRDWY
jgi:hypothetical protein